MGWMSRWATAASMVDGLSSVLGQIDGIAQAVRGRTPLSSEDLVGRARHGLEHRLCYGIASDVVEIPKVAEGDEGDAHADMMPRIAQILERGWGEARQHGRAYIWLVPTDGEDDDQSTPLRPGRPCRMHILAAPEVQDGSTRISDPRSARWDDPTHYQITPRRRVAYSTGRVHWTRLVPIEGLRRTVVRPRTTEGFGGDDIPRDLSVPEVYGHYIDGYQATHVGAIRSMLAKSTLFLRVPTGGATAGEQSQLFGQLMRDLAPRLGIFGVGMLDAAYELDRHDVSVSGSGEVAQVAAAGLSLPESIPLSILFGTPPSGLSTDDQGTARRWEAFRRRVRTSTLDPVILALLDRLVGPGQRRVVWPDPAPATAAEALEALQAYATHLRTLVDGAIITAEQAATLYEEHVGRELPQPAPIDLGEPNQAEVDRIAAMQGIAPPGGADGDGDGEGEAPA